MIRLEWIPLNTEKKAASFQRVRMAPLNREMANFKEFDKHVLHFIQLWFPSRHNDYLIFFIFLNLRISPLVSLSLLFPPFSLSLIQVSNYCVFAIASRTNSLNKMQVNECSITMVSQTHPSHFTHAHLHMRTHTCTLTCAHSHMYMYAWHPMQLFIIFLNN